MFTRTRIVRLAVAAVVVGSLAATASVVAAQADSEPDGRGSAAATDATAGPAVANLQYNTIQPCRAFDSRNSTDGKYNAGETRDLFLSGDGSAGEDFPAQGGKLGGCGIPVGAAAVMINITAVQPDGSGFVRAWPLDGSSEPNATILSFSPGISMGNGIAVPTFPGVTGDIKLRVRTSSTHIVGDVVGYFSSAAT